MDAFLSTIDTTNTGSRSSTEITTQQWWVHRVVVALFSELYQYPDIFFEDRPASDLKIKRHLSHVTLNNQSTDVMINSTLELGRRSVGSWWNLDGTLTEMNARTCTTTRSNEAKGDK